MKRYKLRKFGLLLIRLIFILTNRQGTTWADGTKVMLAIYKK